MTIRFLAAAALAIPTLASAEAHGPSGEELTLAAMDAFAMLGCSLDVSDPTAAEAQIGATMAEILGVEAARIQTPDGDLYSAVDDAFEVMLANGQLVVDPDTMTATLSDCTPAQD